MGSEFVLLSIKGLKIFLLGKKTNAGRESLVKHMSIIDTPGMCRGDTVFCWSHNFLFPIFQKRPSV